MDSLYISQVSKYNLYHSRIWQFLVVVTHCYHGIATWVSYSVECINVKQVLKVLKDSFYLFTAHIHHTSGWLHAPLASKNQLSQPQHV